MDFSLNFSALDLGNLTNEPDFYYKWTDFSSWVVIRRKKFLIFHPGKMREKFGFLICLWILLWGICLGRFVVEKNSLKLMSPDSIRGVYDCSIGNFGVPQYVGNLVGTVIYPKANQRACRSFEDFGIFFRSRPGGLPTFLLVDRGDCFFTLKAWYAQKAGAAAVLVADDIHEPLITMDTPEEEYHYRADYRKEVTIPSALISKSLGNSIKRALTSGEIVTVNLEWGESPRHHDHERVEYEFWTNSNNKCGPNCDSQIEFVMEFKGAAQTLEQKGYTKFTPHYMTWYCPEAFVLSRQCKSQCINHGRYCAPDPEQDFSKGYNGKDVMIQNLRQACLFKVANESGKPSLWWDYVIYFATRCRMEEHKYNKECADEVIRSLGVDLTEIDECIGDTEADVENPVLKAEQDAQIGKGSRGDITMLPTLVINNRQYRGMLHRGAVLKAIRESLQEATDQASCLSEGLESYVETLKEPTAMKGSVQPEGDLQKVTVNVQPDAILQTVGKQEIQQNLGQILRKLLPQLNPFPVYLQD